MWFIIIIVIIVIAVIAGITITAKRKDKEIENKRMNEYNKMLSDLSSKSDYDIQSILDKLGTILPDRRSIIERGGNIDYMEFRTPVYHCRTYGEAYKLQEKALNIKKSRKNNK